ncbi:DUF305 domain-containing protein [Pontibacter populi]|uniref:DUF305 domain-containing protein n=1 Tax=Pontibacter populi TaxID=890055 RepID=A0ABV1RXY0_9BACT
MFITVDVKNFGSENFINNCITIKNNHLNPATNKPNNCCSKLFGILSLFAVPCGNNFKKNKSMRINLVRKRSFDFLLAASLALSSCDSDKEAVAPVAYVSATEASMDADKLRDQLFDKGTYQAIPKALKAVNDINFTCDKNIDHATMMLIHHELILEIAELELEYGNDPATLFLANQIKTENEARIAHLEAFLDTEPVPVPLSPQECKEHLAMMRQHIMSMIQCMNSVNDSPDPDTDFLALMSCHHEDCECHHEETD